MKFRDGELQNALMHLDADILTPNRLSALHSILPTQEEINKVQPFKASPLLSTSEKFISDISEIPQLEDRVEFLTLKSQMGTRISELTEV